MKLFEGERYYHRIPGLLIGRKLNNPQINISINAFIDVIPELIEKLEGNFANINKPNRKNNCMYNLEMLHSLLQGVYARRLETEAMKLLRYVKDENQLPYVLKNMKPFISEVLSLSIEMQKAQLFEKEKLEESLSKIEVLSNITKNINTIGSLINNGEYGKAKTIIMELAEFIPSEKKFVKLLDLIKQQNYEEAERTINILMLKYEESLKKLEEVDMSKIIMAVDDMPEILSFVNNALKNHFKVIAVPGGKAALKAIEMQKPDLFILDIDMPEMNGYELAEKIRSNPGHVKTPLIFLTGNSKREHITKAMAVGCNDFIVKPASHEILLTKAEKFLNTN